jgi:general secretion pathway protein N
MRARDIILLAIAAYAIFLVATMPARWALSRLALPSSVALSDVSGTVWRGAARASFAPGAGDAGAELRWHFLPARLVSGRLAFALHASGPALEGRAEIARAVGGFEAHDVSVRGAASRIAAFVPLLAAWRPQGTVTVEAPAIAWDGKTARGSARAEWRSAGLALTDVRPLGSYRLEARGAGGPLELTVATLQGPLSITGRGSFTPPAALAFSGEARAEGANAAALEPLLNLLGPRRADGARTVDIRSR